MREIETARTVLAINEAADNGYYPLIVAIQPDPRFTQKLNVKQDRLTRKISISSKEQSEMTGITRTFNPRPNVLKIPGCEEKTVFYTEHFYPYIHRLPFAAYLIPPGIAQYEKVFVSDVIEDVVKSIHHICVPTLVTTEYRRLDECEAIWNGDSLELDWDESKIAHSSMVG